MESQIKGASILVTGANGGIGRETVKMLMERKAESIVLACRSEKKAKDLYESLSSENNSGCNLIALGGFDMSNERSIELAIKNLPVNIQLDIVFLQAGGMVVARDFQFVGSEDQKIEETVYQNTLGPYLTFKQLDVHGFLKKNARIVFAGGEGARGIPGMIKKPAFESAKSFRDYLENGGDNYSALNAIGVSKFTSALLVQKLAGLNDEKEYIWFSPGLTSGTKGLDTLQNPKRFIMKRIGFPMMSLIGIAQSPLEAARKYTDCLDGIHGSNGDILGAPEGKALGRIVDQKPMNAALTNQLMIEEFWNLCKKHIPELIPMAIHLEYPNGADLE